MKYYLLIHVVEHCLKARNWKSRYWRLQSYNASTNAPTNLIYHTLQSALTVVDLLQVLHRLDGSPNLLYNESHPQAYKFISDD